MQLTVSKQTAKALSKSILFTLAGATTKESNHTELDNEAMKVLGINSQQAYSLVLLMKNINGQLKSKPKKK